MNNHSDLKPTFSVWELAVGFDSPLGLMVRQVAIFESFEAAKAAITAKEKICHIEFQSTEEKTKQGLRITFRSNSSKDQVEIISELKVVRDPYAKLITTLTEELPEELIDKLKEELDREE